MNAWFSHNFDKLKSLGIVNNKASIKLHVELKLLEIKNEYKPKEELTVQIINEGDQKYKTIGKFHYTGYAGNEVFVSSKVNNQSLDFDSIDLLDCLKEGLKQVPPYRYA